MGLYAISDLHLALSGDKPMHVFGEHWYKHDEKIKNNWLEKIKEEDTVLIAGDISWSIRMEEGLKELDWIHELPGRKILIKGNHDYWWQSISKLNNLYNDMNFIQNNYFVYEDYAVCGTRGWICPGGEHFTAHDEKIYSRELIRLKLSLEAAVKDEYKKFIVMLHYPPTNERFGETEFTKILKEYNVEKVLYGHLHGPSFNRVFEGSIEGIEYLLTSADYIDFNPIKIF
jgi:predicted phosphohydrolase